MKAFLQYLVYLCTGKTVQQQKAAKVRPIIVEPDSILLDPEHLTRSLGTKRMRAQNYLGDKWLLHPTNRVQRKAAYPALAHSVKA